MNIDATGDLRQWVATLEKALGAVVSCGDDGAFAVRTKGHAMVGVEPVPRQRSLILTGGVGTADDAISARKLRALLALNLAAGLSGTGCIGLAPENNALLLRLNWTPSEAGWNEDSFARMLMAFAEHVDALSAAIANGEVEAILKAEAPTARPKPRSSIDARNFA